MLELIFNWLTIILCFQTCSKCRSSMLCKYLYEFLYLYMYLLSLSCQLFWFIINRNLVALLLIISSTPPVYTGACASALVQVSPRSGLVNLKPDGGEKAEANKRRARRVNLFRASSGGLAHRSGMGEPIRTTRSSRGLHTARPRPHHSTATNKLLRRRIFFLSCPFNSLFLTSSFYFFLGE